MIKIINGKTYNTDTAKSLFDQSVYSDGNYSGSNNVMITPKGSLFIYYSDNNQDCHRCADIHAATSDEIIDWLNGREVTEDEIKVLLENGVPFEEA